MPDLPIVIPDTAAAPKDYTLSGTQELQLKTVRALIDGTGAGSAFLPTLQLLDPNGHVMWEGATQSKVAAGGSADVSWFPGLGASGATFAASWITCLDTLITVPAGAVYTQYNFTPATTFTNDGTTFTIDAANGLKLNSTGWYQLSATLKWLVNSPAVGYAEMQWQASNVGARASYCVFADDAGVDALATTYQTWGFPMDVTTVGSHGKLFLRHFGASDATCSLVFAVSRVSDDSGNF